MGGKSILQAGTYADRKVRPFVTAIQEPEMWGKDMINELHQSDPKLLLSRRKATWPFVINLLAVIEPSVL